MNHKNQTGCSPFIAAFILKLLPCNYYSWLARGNNFVVQKICLNRGPICSKAILRRVQLNFLQKGNKLAMKTEHILNFVKKVGQSRV